MKYRCLSLWQPWATLAAMGVKKFETRGRDTKIRGTVLIHAAQNMKGVNMICNSPAEESNPFRAVLPGMFNEGGFRWTYLPFGAIVGAANITATYNSEVLKRYMVDGFVWPEMARFFGTEEAIERAFSFGDYGPGRYGWRLEDCIQFKNPIPARGGQGFFFWEGDIPEMKDFPFK